MQASLSNELKLTTGLVCASSLTLSGLLFGWAENDLSAQTVPPAEPPVLSFSLKSKPVPLPTSSAHHRPIANLCRSRTTPDKGEGTM